MLDIFQLVSSLQVDAVFTYFELNIINTEAMGRLNKGVQVIAYAFLWLYLMEGSSATRREDLERAAERAVERAAERAAERAVEKALESGNSTSESETIRESYSSVRKYDKSLQLPETGYTPAQRHEYDRIMREREAAERASAVLKRSIVDEQTDSRDKPLEVANVDQTAQPQRQRAFYENLSDDVSPPASWLFRSRRQLPFPGTDRVSNGAIHARGYTLQENQQRLTPISVYSVREELLFHSSKSGEHLFNVISSTALVFISTLTYPHYVNR